MRPFLNKILLIQREVLKFIIFAARKQREQDDKKVVAISLLS